MIVRVLPSASTSLARRSTVAEVSSLVVILSEPGTGASFTLVIVAVTVTTVVKLPSEIV